MNSLFWCCPSKSDICSFISNYWGLLMCQCFRTSLDRPVRLGPSPFQTITNQWLDWVEPMLLTILGLFQFFSMFLRFYFILFFGVIEIFFFIFCEIFSFGVIFWKDTVFLGLPGLLFNVVGHLLGNSFLMPSCDAFPVFQSVALVHDLENWKMCSYPNGVRNFESW